MPVAKRLFLAAWLLIALSGCALAPVEMPVRVALVAPFEGRYREIGYNALYATRMAVQDSAESSIELLAVDDGGSWTSAVARAGALALDPQTRIAVALGYAATLEETQRAFGDLPVIVVGHWNTQPALPNVFVLASSELDAVLTVSPGLSVTDAAGLPAPLIGGDVFALAQFPRLRADLEGVMVASSATLPDRDFAARYRASDVFAPPPGLLTSLVYDAARMAVQVVVEPDRAAVARALANIRYSGLNGPIRFENGWWADAPIHRYRYNDGGELTPVDGVVE